MAKETSQSRALIQKNQESRLDENLQNALIEALKDGFRNRENLSPLVPSTFNGISQWAHTVEGLRRHLRPLQWIYESEQNLPIMFSPRNDLCIVTFSGCDLTGQLNYDGVLKPTNKSPKGKKLQQICLENNPNGDLFPDTVPTIEKWKAGSIPTAVLLYHLDRLDPDNLILRSELSIPSKFEKRHITDWDSRIILPEIHLDGIGQTIDLDKEFEPADVEVPVDRRKPE